MAGPSNPRRMSWLRDAVVALAGLTIAACGSQAAVPAAGTPLPAGSAPSEIAKMVCQPKAQREINTVLGDTSTIGTPAWSDHLYSCRYGFADGAFSLSVKELCELEPDPRLLPRARRPPGIQSRHLQPRPGSVSDE